MSNDAAYLHSLVFITQSYFGTAGGSSGFGRLAAGYLAKTLALLQLRLQDAHLATTDSTIRWSSSVAVCTLSAAVHSCGLRPVGMVFTSLCSDASA